MCGWAAWVAEFATKVPPELVPQPWPGFGFSGAGLPLPQVGAVGLWESSGCHWEQGAGPHPCLESRFLTPTTSVCSSGSFFLVPGEKEDKVQLWGGRKLFHGGTKGTREQLLCARTFATSRGGVGASLRWQSPRSGVRAGRDHPVPVLEIPVVKGGWAVLVQHFPLATLVVWHVPLCARVCPGVFPGVFPCVFPCVCVCAHVWVCTRRFPQRARTRPELCWVQWR